MFGESPTYSLLVTPGTRFDDLLSATKRKERQARVDQLIEKMGPSYCCYRPTSYRDIGHLRAVQDLVARAVSQHPDEDGERYAYG